MFFVYHLQTYSPKNRAWKKVIDYVEKYKNVLIKDELSLDALKHEIGDTVNRINAEHPNMSKHKKISEDGIFVTSQRSHSATNTDEYSYMLSYGGNYIACDMSADELREIIACMQNALKANGEGGEK